MTISSWGKLAPKKMLVDVAQLEASNYARGPT
jgi:hypothetical protein